MHDRPPPDQQPFYQQFAFLIAVLSWIWTITRRDPMAAPLSSETVARIQKPGAEDDIVSKERIFAAVGIKMNKPGAEEEPEEAREEERERRQPVLIA